jgi:ribosomal protein S18 acetylase RimI-like enzyme
VTRETVLRPAVVADAEGIARVHFEAADATYRAVLPHRLLAQFSYEQRLRLWRGLFEVARNPLPIEVASDPEGRVLGFAWWRLLPEGDGAFDAEIMSLYVDPAAQRRGLGRRLLGRAAERLAHGGAESCYLWVFMANRRARRFYEAFGARRTDRGWEAFEDVQVPTLAYAWKPIQDLVAAAGEGS